MTMSADAVWEVQPASTNADDTHGGGFVSTASGTDYSYGAGLTHFHYTDLETDGGTLTKLVSVARPFVAADIGNIINIISATHLAAAGRYQITAVTGGVATLDRAWATEDTDDHKDGVAVLGGALATPGMLTTVLTIHKQRANIKTGTYTLTTATPGTGGPISLTSSLNFHVSGYNTTRFDNGVGPTISAGAIDSITVVACLNVVSTYLQHVENLIIDGNSRTAIIGINLTDIGNRAVCCAVSNCTTTGIANGEAYNCRATACGVGFTSSTASRCSAGECTTGFQPAVARSIVSGCLAYDCTGDGFDSAALAYCKFINCTSQGNGGDGFDVDGAASAILIDCISTGHASGYGYKTPTITIPATLINCVSNNVNASGRWVAGTAPRDIGAIDITGSPFVAAATDDYRLNAGATTGALLRDKAINIGTQTDNRDLGAVQHSDPARANYRIGI